MKKKQSYLFLLIIGTALIIGGCSLLIVVGKHNNIDDFQENNTRVDSAQIKVLTSDKNRRLRNRESKRPP